MTPRLAAAMREHFTRFRLASGSPWVFHHERTRRQYRACDRIGSFYGAFKRAAAAAGLPRELRQHDLRHRRATTLLAEGKSAALVKEMLGHSDLRTTMEYYSHIQPEHLRELVDEEPSVGRTTSRARAKQA